MPALAFPARAAWPYAPRHGAKAWWLTPSSSPRHGRWLTRERAATTPVVGLEAVWADRPGPEGPVGMGQSGWASRDRPGSDGPGSDGPGSIGPGSIGPGSIGPGSIGPGSLPPGAAPVTRANTAPDHQRFRCP